MSEYQDTLTEAIKDWAATRPDEVVFDPKKGFYSFEIVSDAFEKGKEKMLEEMKSQMRNKFYSNAKLGADALHSLLESLIKQKYNPLKFFVNNSTQGTTIIFSIKQDVYSDETFIDFAYGEALKIEAKHHEANHNLHISFINDVDQFNLDLLKTDGFGFAYDLSKNIPIF